MSELLIDAFSKLAIRQRELAAGDILFRTGDRVSSLHLVVSGIVCLIRSLPNGSQLTLQRAVPGSIVAEASLSADCYHCEAVASDPTVVRTIPRSRIETALAGDPRLARAWAGHLARSVQQARAIAAILSLKTVAERLDAWIALNEIPFPPKGQRRQVASEIGVTAEALYRELARRRPGPPRV